MTSDDKTTLVIDTRGRFFNTQLSDYGVFDSDDDYPTTVILLHPCYQVYSQGVYNELIDKGYQPVHDETTLMTPNMTRLVLVDTREDYKKPNLIKEAKDSERRQRDREHRQNERTRHSKAAQFFKNSSDKIRKIASGAPNAIKDGILALLLAFILPFVVGPILLILFIVGFIYLVSYRRSNKSSPSSPQGIQLTQRQPVSTYGNPAANVASPA